MPVVYALPVPAEQAPQRKQHGNSTRCAVCGAALHPKRASRRQRFCSDRCRDEDRRARNFAKIGRARYPHSGVPRSVKNSAANSSTSKGEIAGRGSAIPWQRIIETEVIEAHAWEPVTSTDGVVCQVARLMFPSHGTRKNQRRGSTKPGRRPARLWKADGQRRHRRALRRGALYLCFRNGRTTGAVDRSLRTGRRGQGSRRTPGHHRQ